MISYVKEFMKKSIRVWHILKKPTSQEFKTISKVSAIGIALIGLIGFIIALAMNFLIR